MRAERKRAREARNASEGRRDALGSQRRRTRVARDPLLSSVHPRRLGRMSSRIATRCLLDYWTRYPQLDSTEEPRNVGNGRLVGPRRKVNDTISQLGSQARATINVRARATYDSCVNFIVPAAPLSTPRFVSFSPSPSPLRTSTLRVNRRRRGGRGWRRSDFMVARVSIYGIKG